MIGSMVSAETSQTFSRGLDVLQLLASSPLGRTPSQLAAELSLSRTVIYRLVNTLIEHRLVRRTDAGAIVMAPGALALTENVLGSMQHSVNATLAELAAECEATAHFCVADGDDILAVAVEEPPATTFHLAYRVGSRTPRGLGALGTAIAAAQRGEAGVFESEGQLMAGAYGMVASLPGLGGPPAAIGLVVLAGQESEWMRERLTVAAQRLTDAFRESPGL